jgi:5-methylthioribose kinase
MPDQSFPFSALTHIFNEGLIHVSLSPPYVLCKKDMHKGNRMIDDYGEMYFIDNEFFQICPISFDLFEIMTNLCRNQQQRERFKKRYGKKEFDEVYDQKIVRLLAILKIFSMIITYYQSSHKDPMLMKRIRKMTQSVLNNQHFIQVSC